MSKFKSGDKVRVKAGMVHTQSYEKYPIVTIKIIDNSFYTVEENEMLYTDEMLEEQRLPVVGDKIRGKNWTNTDLYFTVSSIFYGEINIYIEGINSNGDADYYAIKPKAIQIIEPEQEFEVLEEIEYILNNDVYKTIDSRKLVDWSAKTGRKFKKHADGRMELME